VSLNDNITVKEGKCRPGVHHVIQFTDVYTHKLWGISAINKYSNKTYNIIKIITKINSIKHLSITVINYL